MHIQLLSFKYDVCHKEFEPKSTTASWNATSSCLLSSHLATPHGQLRMRIASFYELLKISLRSAYVKTLAYTTGATSKYQRATWLELYPNSIVFLRIVAWHMRVFSHLLNVWGYGAGMLRCYQKRWKKRISIPNFETSSHQNVTANKPIGNVYFMYVDMAWFKSLSSTTCCIRLYDPCIKYAQCLCADGLIWLARTECFFA